jgi:hypothetical protein
MGGEAPLRLPAGPAAPSLGAARLHGDDEDGRERGEESRHDQPAESADASARRPRRAFSEGRRRGAVWGGPLGAVGRLAQEAGGLRDGGTRRVCAAERVEHHEVVVVA